MHAVSLCFVTFPEFYSLTLPDDKDSKQDIRILNEIENIDDDLEREGIVIVRIDNDAEAKEYGIDHLPALIYFEEKLPAIYEGKFQNSQIKVTKICVKYLIQYGI
jgi:hypothetical protein